MDLISWWVVFIVGAGLALFSAVKIADTKEQQVKQGDKIFGSQFYIFCFWEREIFKLYFLLKIFEYTNQRFYNEYN